MLLAKEARDSLLANCQLCPRQCGANRLLGKGACGGGDRAVVAKVSLHPWEEPVLTGEKGAGTVFFSGCSLRCVFCQNYEISHQERGVAVSDEELGRLFLRQQAAGAAVLDLVTPTHYAPQIINGIYFARQEGLSLPVAYNSSGYEAIAALEMLKGSVDVFLPDLKYYDSSLSGQYSGAPDYFAVASGAIEKMVELAGPPVLNDDGIMTGGVLVRHMVLPGARKDSMKLLDWLWSAFGDDIYLSLMSQYTPMYRAREFPKLGRRLTTFEYESVTDYAAGLGFTRCFVQERSSADAAYVPDWNDAGVLKQI